MTHDAYFFDMDQTLTRSKSEIEGEHFKLLTKLAYNVPVVAVSGAVIQQMTKQLLSREIFYLAQNGNHAFTPGSPAGSCLWENRLTEEEIADITTHIYSLARNFYKIDESTVQHRGCQVSFSCVGHDAPLDIKNKFDAKKIIRKTMLGMTPFEHPTLTVKIGGTTCFDYVRKNGTKGDNVKRFMDYLHLRNPIYIGDALFPGGNDDTVVGVCKTLQVDSVEETYSFIKDELAK